MLRWKRAHGNDHNVQKAWGFCLTIRSQELDQKLFDDQNLEDSLQIIPVKSNTSSES